MAADDDVGSTRWSSTVGVVQNLTEGAGDKEQLDVHRYARESCVVLAVLGELDLAGAPRLRQSVVSETATGIRHLVLDLTAVDFIDSTGLGVVVGALRRLRAHGAELSVVCPEQRIRRVFEICDLDRVFTLHGTVDDAVSASGSV